MSEVTLLSQISKLLTIDVDSMDPEVAIQHTRSSFSFCDMTSNQAIVQGQATRPERAHVLECAINLSKSKGDGVNPEHVVDKALDILTVLFAKEVYPQINGRVHAQTSPSVAYDTEKTIEHAKRLVSIFEANGIPKDRVCIKIPATPQSIIACQYLEKIGIRTLATCLFSVAQAVAASQAGCLYIAPYFNELRVHFDPTLWKEYTDTAREHPMSTVISEIIQVFKKLRSSTLVMPASIVTSAEVMALASLHPDHLTLSGAVLDQLASLVPVPDHELSERSSPPSASTKVAEIDFLEDGAHALKTALEADAETTRKLTDALKIFGEMEQKAKDLMRDKIVAS
ncbi:hypothetical protein PILCRDRAFT_829717 [Piloderma croceum F 1598]|uniref:Transaldolase n=1 Tax=Piloderma croceum (strain F 1598) TaxID=765440 RepID=A0A0C3EWT7_PILCF|nr:hypothetical protein PILCRDRAFT_829717 [Piloderma croceum F 1598]